MKLNHLHNSSAPPTQRTAGGFCTLVPGVIGAICGLLVLGLGFGLFARRKTVVPMLNSSGHPTGENYTFTSKRPLSPAAFLLLMGRIHDGLKRSVIPPFATHDDLHTWQIVAIAREIYNDRDDALGLENRYGKKNAERIITAVNALKSPDVQTFIKRGHAAGRELFRLLGKPSTNN